MRFLRTNTAARVTVGPFFDKTDGVTPETALTVTACKLTLMVDDANVPTIILDVAPTASGGANDMVHVTGDDAGFYDLELAAANVNYLGRAMLAITDAATHCPVFHEFMILPAMVYDSMVLGTDTLNADVTQFGGTNLTAAAGIPEVKVNNIAANAITAASIATDAIDADAIADNAINAAAIAADAITDAKVASDVTIASVTGAVGSVTGNVGGNVTGSIGSVATGGITAGSIAADAIGASELAADAITEIQSGLATAAGVTAAVAEVNVASIDANVITETAIANDAFTADKFAAAAFTAAKFATDAIDANALAADAVGEIQNGLATSANQTAIINLLSGVVLASGTIGATGNTTTTLHLAGIAWANDAPNSLTLVIKDVSTGLFYSRWIEDWADTGDLATVATLPFTPQASTDLYWILPNRSDVTGGSGLDAAGVRAAIGLASANLDTQLDALPTNAELATALGTADDAVLAQLTTLAGYVDTEVAAIKAKTDNLPTDPADASDIAASFVSIASTLSTLASYVDTEVAAIKAKTDSLTFTVAGAVDANIQRVNDVAVVGTGAPGDEWGA